MADSGVVVFKKLAGKNIFVTQLTVSVLKNQQLCNMKFLILWLAALPFSMNGQPGAVVVELFTSQGCSSCPAADQNLKEIMEWARAEGRPVYGLSFHVDYWNHIGWKDPYSSKDFTDRQRWYASQRHLSSIYTPQMIVNGENEFVGSDRVKAEETILRTLRVKSAYKIIIDSPTVDASAVKIRYHLNKRPEGETLNIAFVSQREKNFVPRGENSGRTLEHAQVVRLFSQTKAEVAGELRFAVLTPSVRQGSVVLFISDRDGKILGASARLFHAKASHPHAQKAPLPIPLH